MKKSFKQFLSDQMEKFNSYDEKKLKDMCLHFELVLTTIVQGLGEDAFAKYKVENNKLKLQSHFNAAVYDAIAVAVSDKIHENSEFSITEEMQHKINELFYDEEFIDCINGSTNDKSKILNRIKIVKGALK
jgi:hypothetical protein